MTNNIRATMNNQQKTDCDRNKHAVIHIVDWQHHESRLKKIRHQVFVNEQQVPEELEWDEFDPGATHFLVTVNHSDCATARLKQDGQIGRMSVLAAYRNKTIGQQLLDFIIEHARHRKIPCLFLHAQIQVVDFYKKRDFIEQGEIFMDAGIAHRKMIKVLYD